MQHVIPCITLVAADPVYNSALPRWCCPASQAWQMSGLTLTVVQSLGGVSDSDAVAGVSNVCWSAESQGNV